MLDGWHEKALSNKLYRKREVRGPSSWVSIGLGIAKLWSGAETRSLPIRTAEGEVSQGTSPFRIGRTYDLDLLIEPK
jgi:hypothetical protein